MFAKAVAMKRKRKSNTTILQKDFCTSHQQPKIDKVNFNNNNRTPIIEFSNCSKTYLMFYIVLRRQELIFIIRNSPNHYANIKAQTSDELQPLEKFENSTVVFDDKLLSKKEGNINLFFTRGHHNNIDIYYISRSYFRFPKLQFVNIVI